MRKLILILMLFGATVAGAITYTEFYVQPTGNNLNAGSTTDNAAIYTGTGYFTNNTSATECTWNKSGESLAGVTVGMWASIFTNTITTNTPFVGRVTAVDDTADTITVSLKHIAGTVPSSDNDGNTTIKIGGAWAGPNTNTASSASGFPFGFALYSMTNAAGNAPRINFLNSAVYYTTNAITHNKGGVIRFQGYAATPGDGGKATIDGTTVYPGYNLITFASGASAFELVDFIFSHNGADAAAKYGVYFSSSSTSSSLVRRCVFHDLTYYGFYTIGGNILVSECEAYACNTHGSTGSGGFGIATGNGVELENCISHDNIAANSTGFDLQVTTAMRNCIAYNNATAGIRIKAAAAGSYLISGCNVVSNGTCGIDMSASTYPAGVYIKNCNLFYNKTYGIDSPNGVYIGPHGYVLNCAFGSGTMTNGSGSYSVGVTNLDISGTIVYTANQTPWVDWTNGNFTLSSSTTLPVKAAGSSVFTQSTVNPPTNTVSYPDIGAVQSASTNAAGGEHSHVFAQ